MGDEDFFLFLFSGSFLSPFFFESFSKFIEGGFCFVLFFSVTNQKLS